MTDTDSDEGYKPVERFLIDHGELEGQSLQECFCLGVEWEMIRQKRDTGELFITMVHSANADRLRLLLRDRQFKFTHDHADVSESWMILAVEGGDA